MKKNNNLEKNNLGIKDTNNISTFNTIDNSHTLIANEIINQNKSVNVLEIGFNEGFLGSFLNDYNNVKIDFLDIKLSNEKNNVKNSEYSSVFKENIDNFLLKENNKKKYDYIVLLDIAEKVYDPDMTIKKISSLLTKNGSIIASVSNISNIAIIKGIINNKFNYTENGVSNISDLRFFTLKSFAEMINNINEDSNDKFDLSLLNVTKYIPKEINDDSELFKIMNLNNSANTYKLVFKLNVSKNTPNLNSILSLKEVDIYNLLERAIADHKILNIQNEKLSKENTDLFLSASSMINENRQIKADYNAIISSKSWKMARFFSKLLGLLKKVKYKLSRVKTKTRIALTNEKNKTNDVNEFLYVRKTSDELVELFSQYDVISFDIFDTLIFRPFVKPTDLFSLIESQEKVFGFSDNRIKAEQEARKITKKNNFEINIHDIYDILNKNLEFKKIDLKELEWKYECDYCYANPFMQEVLNKLQKLGKEIVITSDMYWPKEYLFKLLKKCGYKNLNNIFVSCDYEVNKGTGKLQKVVNKNFNNKTFIHIGDNYLSDIVGSKKAKWNTYYYKSCKDVAVEIDDPMFTDSIENSIYTSIGYNYLYNGSIQENMHYNYGFKYGGLLTCGFLDHINKICNDKKIDKIMFLARDSKVFYDAYNKYYNKYDNDYVITSRSAMYEACFETNIHDFIEFYFASRAKMKKYTIEESLIQTDLRLLLPFVRAYKMSLSDILSTSNYNYLYKLIYDKKDIIIDYFKPSKEACIEYFNSIIGNRKNLLAVDLGWSGTIISLMRSFIRENISDDICLIATFIGNKNSLNVNSLVDQEIFIPYCFSYCNNYTEMVNVETVRGSSSALILEAMFTSNDYTLLKYGDEFIYSEFSTNNDSLKDIHRGIMDYVKIISKIKIPFINEKYIDSFTAFRPVFNALCKPEMNYIIFKNYKEYSDSLPRFEGEKNITTIGKILKDRNII